MGRSTKETRRNKRARNYHPLIKKAPRRAPSAVPAHGPDGKYEGGPIIKAVDPREFEAPAPRAPDCEHPKSMTPGVCKRESVGTFDIPPDYKPAIRHANQPPIPRPRALLCRQHRGMVEGFTRTGGYVNGHTHETQCDACRHQKIAWVVDMWVNFRMNREEAVRELGVSYITWDRHVDYYGLDLVRMKKDKRKRLYLEMIEKGMKTNTHTAKTALAAAIQLGKEEGDMPAERVNVTGVVGHVDLTKLTGDELAGYMETLAAQVRAAEMNEGKQQAALPAGGGNDRTIDLPRSAIKVSTRKSEE